MLIPMCIYMTTICVHTHKDMLAPTLICIITPRCKRAYSHSTNKYSRYTTLKA